MAKKTVYLSSKKEGNGAWTVRETGPALAPAVDLLRGFAQRPPGALAAALMPAPGLSVRYQGLPALRAMSAFGVESDGVDGSDPRHPRRRVVLANAVNRLALEIEYVHYPQHNAVVFGGEIVNRSTAPIRNVRELCSFDIALDAGVTGDTVLYTIGGGVTHFVFPPFAFQVDKRRVMGSLWPSFTIDSGDTGRSSDRYLPFFYITDENDASGLYAGLEWSGIWKIAFHRHEEYLYVHGGMLDVDLTLRPGERIPMPRALLGFYEGSIHDGRNAMRRFISDWFPLYEGKPLETPVTWNHAFTFGPTINDATFRKQVPVCAELGFEWMQIDWGWFAGCAQHREAGGSAHTGIGNWTRVDPERFPNGIEPLADLVRSHGMKYCTWVDPEQAHPTSDIAREHPEWMLYVDDARREMCMVNFALREVQDHFIELIDRQIIKRWGVHKLKWDHNIDPREYWNRHDDPEHKGLLQIRHIRGVWRVWEELRRRNPQLVLENCSSGGRRFDLGTFARAHVHHGSDFNFQHDIVRSQISGLNTVMPSFCVIHTCTWGDHASPDVYYQSRFGGILRFSQDFASWPAEARERAKKHIAVYKSIRRHLKGDFYALFPQPRDLEEWDGWQFHDPSADQGFVLAFRARSPEARRSARLRGLRPQRTYTFTDPYSGEEVKALGAALMDEGFAFSVERDAARLYRYAGEGL